MDLETRADTDGSRTAMQARMNLIVNTMASQWQISIVITSHRQKIEMLYLRYKPSALFASFVQYV